MDNITNSVGVHWSIPAREGSWRNWATEKDDEEYGQQKEISTKEILNPSTAFCQVMYFEPFHKIQMLCLEEKMLKRCIILYKLEKKCLTCKFYSGGAKMR